MILIFFPVDIFNLKKKKFSGVSIRVKNNKRNKKIAYGGNSHPQSIFSLSKLLFFPECCVSVPTVCCNTAIILGCDEL